MASIRRNMSGGQNTKIDVSPGGRLTVTNASLKTLIRNAYGILPFQLAGEPRWLDTDMYDIVAKTENVGTISTEQLKPLLQNLLAERFRLEVHWETRETPIYALVVEESGPKFQESTSSERPGMNTSKSAGKGRMKGTRETMANLASNLGNQSGRFTLDTTGLAGFYDFTLEWDLEQTADSTGPSLFTALREQLGLRLKPQRGPMQILVIDRAERASEN